MMYAIDGVIVGIETAEEGQKAPRTSRRGSYSSVFRPGPHVESTHEIRQTSQEVFRRSIRTKILDV